MAREQQSGAVASLSSSSSIPGLAPLDFFQPSSNAYPLSFGQTNTSHYPSSLSTTPFPHLASNYSDIFDVFAQDQTVPTFNATIPVAQQQFHNSQAGYGSNVNYHALNSSQSIFTASNTAATTSQAWPTTSATVTASKSKNSKEYCECDTKGSVLHRVTKCGLCKEGCIALQATAGRPRCPEPSLRASHKYTGDNSAAAAARFLASVPQTDLYDAVPPSDPSSALMTSMSADLAGSHQLLDAATTKPSTELDDPFSIKIPYIDDPSLPQACIPNSEGLFRGGQGFLASSINRNGESRRRTLEEQVRQRAQKAKQLEIHIFKVCC